MREMHFLTLRRRGILCLKPMYASLLRTLSQRCDLRLRAIACARLLGAIERIQGASVKRAAHAAHAFIQHMRIDQMRSCTFDLCASGA